MIFKIAMYQMILFFCAGYISIREQKRRDRLKAMLDEWMSNNVDKSNIKLRVIR